MNSLRSCQARSKLSNNVRDLSLLTTTVSVPTVLMCIKLIFHLFSLTFYAFIFLSAGT